MLVNKTQNKELIEQFTEFINLSDLTNIQIVSLLRLLPYFNKNDLDVDIINMKNRLNEVLTESISKLSSYELKIAMRNLKNVEGYEPAPLSS